MKKRKCFIKNIKKKGRTEYKKLLLFAGSRRDYVWQPYLQFTKDSLLCIATRSSYWPPCPVFIFQDMTTYLQYY